MTPTIEERFDALRSESTHNIVPTIDFLQKYIRELEADKERLDWLEAQPFDCQRVLGGKVQVDTQYGLWYAKTLRQAIDNATNAKEV